MNDHYAELERHLDWFEGKLPSWAGGLLAWVRKPSSRIVRIPLGILLVIGGIFSFLPVLGLWMLPLGLVLIALDVPFLQGPIARLLNWVERKWDERVKARKARSKARNGT